ncbi:putative porin [Acinetobacter haemolyticus]|uniref:putative porin n=1 Tax=Acinetobacter haemolyticus TaxID=29430 RepID=UPI000D69141F|nr:putative porin [Acinetobacter haemolyticus]MCU4386264.1 putative porin [Acinetobacter haemolyticus]RSN74392.1 putative porin [Acinetobacter haemolyticus]
MKKLSLVTVLLSSFIGFNANAYQAEVNGAYEYTDIDGGVKVNTATISGKYYFNPVQTRNVPLAETAFLDKASNIGLGYTYSKQSMKIGFEENELFWNSPAVIANLKQEFNTIGINGEFFIPNSQFYISGSLHRTDVKDTIKAYGYSYSESIDGTGYALEAGFLPINGLLLAVGVADLSESFDPIQAAKYGFITTYSNAAVVTGEDDDTAVTLRAKYVSQIGGYYTNFEAQTYIGDETTYRLAADLYLDPTLSIGISIADSTADDSDSIFNIRAQKFITPEFALGVGYTTVDGADSYGINGTFRF